ncbi:MAG: hypothetical protein ABEJ91_03395 [Candidatus Nanohaloarchaea archaeon]
MNTAERIDKVLGEKLFQNRSGLAGNLAAAAAERKASILSGADIENPGKPEKGYLELEDAINPGKVENVRKQHERLISEGVAEDARQDGELVTSNLRAGKMDFRDKMPGVRELLSPAIRETVKNYYGTYFRPAYVRSYRNYHVPGEIEKRVEPKLWHLDYFTPDHLRVFIPLDDVSADDGPTQALSWRQTSSLMKRHSYGELNQVDGPAAEREHVEFTGKTGSAFFMNPARSLHRAGNPLPGHHRDVLVFTFEPAAEPLEDDWLENIDRYTKSFQDMTGLSRLLPD